MEEEEEEEEEAAPFVCHAIRMRNKGGLCGRRGQRPRMVLGNVNVGTLSDGMALCFFSNGVRSSVVKAIVFPCARVQSPTLHPLQLYKRRLR